jgi:hypothetical protein
MFQFSLLIARFGILALLIAACGAGSLNGAVPLTTSTPTVLIVKGLTGTCISTKAYAPDLILGLIGESAVPAALDGINSGRCVISEAIIKLRVTLKGEAAEQTATIYMPAPSNTFAMARSPGSSVHSSNWLR